MDEKKFTVVDLFSGAGGLSYGFTEAGFDVRLGVDIDQAACETFEKNHPGSKAIISDIRKVTDDDIRAGANLDTPDVVIGGPSCQGFSTVGQRNFEDPRNTQFQEFVRLVRDLSPKCFIMENVVGLLLFKKGIVARQICDLFDEMGYQTQAKILLAADFGVPQLRRRVFFIGTRTKTSIAFPRPTHCDPKLWADYALPFAEMSSIGNKNGDADLLPHCTVADAIGDLPELGEQDGEMISEYDRPATTQYQRVMRGRRKTLFNHVTGGNSELERKMIRALKPGENWRALPASILPKRFEKIRPYDASTLIMRMCWDKPSYTITTKTAEVTSGAFIHPEQHRTLSIREAARLQSYPDRFRFYGTPIEQRRQIGNSVPPLMAQRLAEAISSLLDEHRDFDESRLLLMEPELEQPLFAN